MKWFKLTKPACSHYWFVYTKDPHSSPHFGYIYKYPNKPYTVYTSSLLSKTPFVGWQIIDITKEEIDKLEQVFKTYKLEAL